MKPETMQAPSRHESESEERARLDGVKGRLHRSVQKIDERISSYRDDVQAQKTYLWESQAEMDHVEKISARQSIEQSLMSGDTLLAKKQRLLKLARSPYFGRFDFTRADTATRKAYYIGVHHFHDEETDKDLIHDWRAPISTLFYDFETGPAAFNSPSGRVDGEVSLKRQFRIRDGKMEFMLESGLNIVDDVLQQELSRTSDDGMKNIVATIQRDQNAIIRDDRAHTLIIQGVAGSGKTSIALHRIAYLLYRFKDTLSSKDILIISPNRVFASYIANVLPELGEETIAEIGMEQLAAELLDHEVGFQSFFEQTAALLESHDEEMKERIVFKSSLEFLRKLAQYAEHVEASRVSPEGVYLGSRLVPRWLIAQTLAMYGRGSQTERVTHVVEATEVYMGVTHHHTLEPKECKTLRAAVKEMMRTPALRKTYQEFYKWLRRPELFKPAKGGKLEYADVFPMIYLKLRLEDVDNPHREVKHLLIDEMQDYTPVQYSVIAQLFKCRKTVLGDVAQSVNPYSASRTEDIRRAFSGALHMTLSKSYRSTLEIMQFVQQICFNPDLEPMERHGAVPRVHHFRSGAEEMEHIRRQAEEFLASEHNSLGIVCKTQKQAGKIASTLDKHGISARLLDASSTDFSNGVIVCSAHMAKGLEFDRVIVPGAGAATYHTPMDRNMLYVACTRAMHLLELTHTGEPTSFLPQ